MISVAIDCVNFSHTDKLNKYAQWSKKRHVNATELYTLLACVFIMGHDISGFRTKDTENEIAYLRRGAFNELNSAIYNALDCHECNGGVSGNGNERQFSKDELIKALEFLGTNEDYEPERKFIADCLANIDDNGNVLVGFY